MLSSGANVIIWEKMISSGANVIMVSSGANVIIWCYHVMLSSGMRTHPFFIFPENFTHSNNPKGKIVKIMVFLPLHCSASVAPLVILVEVPPGHTKQVTYTVNT
jgi:hypothetical protein